MQSKQYKNILSDLESEADIEQSFIISRDGLLIAGEAYSGTSAEALAAMTATLLGAAETALDEIGSGVPGHITVETKKHSLIVMGAGSQALLAVVTLADDHTPVHKAMKQAANAIDEIL
ncbi:MAG: roadblock/LC7 domain-containing protein [Thermoplasmatota archaeon]